MGASQAPAIGDLAAAEEENERETESEKANANADVKPRRGPAARHGQERVGTSDQTMERDPKREAEAAGRRGREGAGLPAVRIGSVMRPSYQERTEAGARAKSAAEGGGCGSEEWMTNARFAQPSWTGQRKWKVEAPRPRHAPRRSRWLSLDWHLGLELIAAAILPKFTMNF